MPAHTNPLPHVLYNARNLPESDPVRVACRARLATFRDRCQWLYELAAALGCSDRHARRLLSIYGLKPYTENSATPARYEQKPTHPPQRWCSCEWCQKARAA